MPSEFQKLSSNYQRTGDEAFRSMTRSAKDVRKSLHGMSVEMAEFSKKSVNQAIELQAQLAKNAFDAFISQLSKFSMLGLVGYGRYNEDQETRVRWASDEETGGGSVGGQTRTRRAATVRRSSASKRSQASSARSEQRTAAENANTHKKTGPAKTNSQLGRRSKVKNKR
jgi:hypothetical protein